MELPRRLWRCGALSVFPQMVYSFDVGREKSIRALDEAMDGDQQMILLMQKDVSVDEPGPDDLYEVGVLVHIRQILKMPGDVVRILVEGLSRAQYDRVHPGKSSAWRAFARSSATPSTVLPRLR